MDLLEQRVEARFEHGGLARLKQGQLFWIHFNTDHAVRFLCETGGRDRPDVAKSKNADIHLIEVTSKGLRFATITSLPAA